MKTILFLFFLFSLKAFGQYDDTSVNNSHHQLGVVADSWEYTEPRIKDSGILWGVHYRFQTLFFDLLQMEAHGELLTGKTDYEGQELFSGNPINFKQTNTIYNTYVFFVLNPSGSNPLFAPFLGLYYRYLVDQDDEFLGDYERNQSYLTLPVGLDLNLHSWKIRFFYHLAFAGENTTHLGDVGGTPEELVMKQNEGSGYQVEVETFFGPFSFTLFYRAWDIADSEAKLAVLPGNPPFMAIEPENETVSFGLRAGYNF